MPAFPQALATGHVVEQQDDLADEATGPELQSDPAPAQPDQAAAVDVERLKMQFERLHVGGTGLVLALQAGQHAVAHVTGDRRAAHLPRRPRWLGALAATPLLYSTRRKRIVLPSGGPRRQGPAPELQRAVSVCVRAGRRPGRARCAS